ncbi:hypothetical protein [Endozoicomonas ascidiicola]|uniref:hypothetical protein n=1 Tax=Endozoicomonas ascidiicola TaxID=1698521 RepID=UPI00082E42B7|nr:hypothetical protein [Endozoicomonas ascidiicola]
MSNKFFDPHKSFLSLKILWIVISIHFSIALLISLAIILNLESKLDFSHSGFNNFLLIFKVPLSILALTIPIIALLAANHRSEQTKEQMRLASQQNDFSNYFKHLEEFEKYCTHIFNVKSARLKSPRKYHDLAFPLSKNGIFIASKNFTEQADKFIEEFIDISDKLKEGEVEERNQTLADLQRVLSNYSEFYQVTSYGSGGGSRINIGENGITIPDGNIKNFLYQIHTITTVINNSLSFDTAYTPSDTFKMILSLKLSVIPDWKIESKTRYSFKAVVNSA